MQGCKKFPRDTASPAGPLHSRFRHLRFDNLAMTERVVRKARPWCALLTLVCVPVLGAQQATGLPAYAPINPLAQARSGLYAAAPVSPTAGWRWDASLDYASLIEYNIGNGDYLLDAEVSRLSLTAGRDLSPRYFLEVGGNIAGAHAGFMDRFFNWYHRVLGFSIPERALRPLNAFAYQVDLPGGEQRIRDPGTHFGDIRVSLGRRHNQKLQSLLSATLPTGTGGDGYARGVPSLSTVTTVAAPVGVRASYQGSVGLGFTPAHGDLSRFQKELFGSLSSGFGFRLWGQNYLYAQLFFHTPYYRNTGYRALDRSELSLNYGWMFQAVGRTWRIGMTEDLAPSGPAVDAMFEFGVTAE